MSVGSLGEVAGNEAGASSTEEDDFEPLIDIPCITVNRIGGQYLGEVFLSDDAQRNEALISIALAVAAAKGFMPLGPVNLDHDDMVFEILFTPLDHGCAA